VPVGGSAIHVEGRWDCGLRECKVFLIGCGAVAGFNVGDEKPPHYYDVGYLKIEP
jgi:hypothetical protein